MSDFYGAKVSFGICQKTLIYDLAVHPTCLVFRCCQAYGFVTATLSCCPTRYNLHDQSRIVRVFQLLSKSDARL
uniref:Uncharacterized protein n=1 Tax=Physcomitrium patens TaxID=3218 RepID=A0A2K1KKT1_PHYPA|nr:hypothetical protein PHYPA_008065 [Physcomitrium patens]